MFDISHFIHSSYFVFSLKILHTEPKKIDTIDDVLSRDDVDKDLDDANDDIFNDQIPNDSAQGTSPRLQHIDSHSSDYFSPDQPQK